MITLGELQHIHTINCRVEERLSHIINIMVDCGVADYIPTDNISLWRYAPERSCVIAEKAYTDSYDSCGDMWESYSIPMECLTMSDDELEEMFLAEYDVREAIERGNAVKQLHRDAEYLGYAVVPLDENTLRELP